MNNSVECSLVGTEICSPESALKDVDGKKVKENTFNGVATIDLNKYLLTSEFYKDYKEWKDGDGKIVANFSFNDIDLENIKVKKVFWNKTKKTVSLITIISSRIGIGVDELLKPILKLAAKQIIESKTIILKK